MEPETIALISIYLGLVALVILFTYGANKGAAAFTIYSQPIAD